jgi:hypothetical protein
MGIKNGPNIADTKNLPSISNRVTYSGSSYVLLDGFFTNQYVAYMVVDNQYINITIFILFCL